MNEKILVIEDDAVITRFLLLALKTNGYLPFTAASGIQGINLAMNESPALILLDLGLPDLEGMEVLKQLRTFTAVPIIIVSARDKEREKVEALDAGADDYLTKPFAVGELLARVRVALRRKTPNTEPLLLFELGKIKVDFERRKVFLRDEEIHFTPIEYKLLTLLIENQGKVLTHAYIQKMVWGYESLDEFQSLRVFMASLRRKIESDTNHPQYILTEIGVGYRFVDEWFPEVSHTRS